MASEQEPIFSKDQPAAATMAMLFIVALFLYVSWLTLGRLIDLINALSSGEIEVHFASFRLRSSWTDKANWREQPWNFIFSVVWVTVEMVALSLLSYGCINALRNLTPETRASDRKK